MTWIYVFKALLTPIIGGVVAYVAHQQHKTNRDKLKLNLYDRRFKVFHSLMSLLGLIVQDSDVSDKELNQFLRATTEANFLFDKEISSYLDTIYKKALDLQYKEKSINKLLPQGEKRNKVIKEKRQLFEWFTKQFEVSKGKFGKYLSFGKSKNWKRGFKRLTWILSIIVGLLSSVYPCWVMYHDTVIIWEREISFRDILSLIPLVLLSAIIGWCFVWGVFLVILKIVIPMVRWITEGFKDTNPKYKQKQ